MAGPTAWQQNLNTVNINAQSITTTSETVIATLSNINSRGSGGAIYFTASAVYAINASTTLTTLRLRVGTLTGTQLTSAAVQGGTAGTQNNGDGTIGYLYQVAGEVSGLVVVLTIQATSAAANWNVNFASLRADF